MLKKDHLKRAIPIVFFLFASAFLFGSARGQDEEVVRIESELVSFEVSARDSRGIPIKGLKAQDFTIFEDGRRQKISHLSSLETPFSLALIIDTSISTQQDLGLIRQAARNFI